MGAFDDTLIEGETSDGSRLLESHVVLPGDHIGRYEVLSRLGTGAMGIVFEAHDPGLDRNVALKLLHQRSAVAQDKALREARALARVDHPNVVQVFDTGRHRDRAFIAMELIDGQTAEGWLATTRGWREIVDVFAQAGRGLLAAHQVGLVHRDFKPSNVMIGADGRVCVTDFGLVESLGAGTDEDPGGGSGSRDSPAPPRILGTPAYMAPEQHFGLEADPRTDQFAFGAALFESLYGVLPFEGPTLEELGRAKSEGRIHSPRSADVPGWLTQIVLRALRPDRKERFRSMEDLLSAIRRGSARRRPWRVALGLAAMTAIFVGAAIPALSGQGTDCERGASELRSVWGAERKARIWTAFEATGLGYARDTYQTIERDVDGFAEAWLSAHTRACTSPEAADGAPHLACLEHQLSRVDATLAVFETANAMTVEVSGLVLEDLPVVERCATARAEEVAAVEVRDQARVATLRDALVRCRILTRAARLDEARELALEVEDGASTLGHQPLVANARLAISEVDRLTQRYEDSAQNAETAFWLAREAGADVTAFEAARQLADVLRQTQLQPNRAQQWLRHARAALDRLPYDPDREGKLTTSTGDLHLAAGRLQAARDEYERASVLWEEAHGPDSTNMATSHNDRATVLARLGQLDGAVYHARRALEIERAHSGPNHPDVARFHNSLGMTFYLHGHFDSALEEFDRAHAVWRASGASNPTTFAEFLNNRGLALEATGRLEEALDHYEQALTIRRQQLDDDHPHVAYTVANIGNTLLRLHRPNEALARYADARDVMQRALGPDHPDVGMASANVGAVLVKLGRYEEARTHSETALAIYERALGRNHPLVADVLGNLATIEDYAGNSAAARGHLERALEIGAARQVGLAKQADLRFRLAEHHWALGDRRAARDAARQAHAQAKEDPELLTSIDTWLATHR